MSTMFSSRTLLVVAMLVMVMLGFAAQRLTKHSASIADQQALTTIEPPLSIPDFSLTDDRGALFNRERLRGRWTFLFFGYTHCPDVCPAAMVTFKQLRTLAGAAQSGIQYVLISVDPERDTPAKLGEYVHYFDPEFIGATGPHSELEKLTKPMGVFYSRSGEGADYQVNHSSAVFLVDPEMRLRGLLPQPHVPQAMAAAFAGIKKR